MAELVNCNPKYISGIESRNKFPSAETIDALASVLEISAAQLFEEEGSPRNVATFDKEQFAEELVTGLHELIREDVLNFLEEKLGG